MAKLRIKAVLKRKGISHRRFSKMIDVDEKNISRLVKVTYDPKLSTLAKWASVLDVRIRDLFEE